MKRTFIAPLLTLGLLLWGLLALPAKGTAQTPSDAATTALRQSQGCYIKLTTSRAVGETIDMKLISVNPRLKDITIEGVKEAPQIGNKKVKYTLTSQTIVLRGSIQSFDCGKSQITKVELIQCPTLESFFLGDNQISELDFTACVKLTNFNCYNNQLTELDLTPLKKLKWFNCYGNKLTKLDLTSCPGVSAIRCQDNQISEIVIPQGSLLSAIDCSKNQLAKLDMSHCTKLRSLNCSDNLLTELDLSHSPALDELVCYNNKIRGEAMTQLIKSLADRSQKTTKGKLKVHFNPTQRPQDGNVCLKSDVALATSKHWVVSYADQELKDPAYEGEEAPLNGSITLTTSRPIGQKISLMIKAEDDFTVEGVDGVPFDGSYIKYTLTSQTITIRGRITQLACWGNDLTAISLENCQDLTILTCSSNKLTTLDLSHCPKLSLLACASNQIKGDAMKALAESLPDRSNTQPGIWQVHKSLDKIAEDGNICLKSDVAIATQRGWRVVLSETNEDYPGADPSASTYTVDLKIGTGGTASITGYSDLKAVPVGTTLTVVASPDEGYKLAQILVNEVDRTESKSFVVKKPTIVQVTFQKVDRIEHVTTSALEIYPNPVTDYLLVRGGASDALLQLYDATGALVLTGQTNSQGTATLALSSIPSGLYILVVGDQPISVLIAR